MMATIAPAGPRAVLSSPLGRCAATVVAYLALAGAASWAGLRQCGIRPGLGETVLCAAPLCTGLALAFSTRRDRSRYFGRLVAAALVLPLLLLAWIGTSEPETAPPSALGVMVAAGALVHLMAAVTGIALLAAALARVPASPGVAPVGAERLGRRLQSLGGAGLALTVRGDARGWQVEIDADAACPRRLRLQVDELNAQVVVHERPPTTIDETRLAATVLAFDGDRALPPHAARAADGAALVRLLCALVTRSGYAWQPLRPPWPARRNALP